MHAPGFRFDLQIEEDLIEEVARVYGYDRIPELTATAVLPLAAVSEASVGTARLADTLAARDYREVVTWSFIDADANNRFTGEESELVLENPISSEMSVMRGSLWPGMLRVAAANVARQQERVADCCASDAECGAPGEGCFGDGCRTVMCAACETDEDCPGAFGGCVHLGRDGALLGQAPICPIGFGLRGSVRSGNSGGPLFSPEGDVLGVTALTGERPWERACADGWEGVIAKRLDSPYEQKRSRHWYKMKCEATQELVVGGFTEVMLHPSGLTRCPRSGHLVLVAARQTVSRGRPLERPCFPEGG